MLDNCYLLFKPLITFDVNGTFRHSGKENQAPEKCGHLGTKIE